MSADAEWEAEDFLVMSTPKTPGRKDGLITAIDLRRFDKSKKTKIKRCVTHAPVCDFGRHALAGSLASGVSLFLCYPLDIVRTRKQLPNDTLPPTTRLALVYFPIHLLHYYLYDRIQVALFIILC